MRTEAEKNDGDVKTFDRISAKTAAPEPESCAIRAFWSRPLPPPQAQAGGKAAPMSRASRSIASV
jgi:hypothetical protein